jgi:hypothetical protein
MKFYKQNQVETLFLLVLGIVAAMVLCWVVVKKEDCEVKGGKRLRGTWAWEQFECYDAKTLKVLK